MCTSMSQVQHHFRNVPISTGRILNVVSVVLGIVIWEWTSRSLSGLLLAPPTAIVQSWINMTLTGELPTALLGSLQHMLLGYFLAAATAVPLGFAMGRSEPVRVFFDPYIDAIYSTPVVAYLPLIIAWFGLKFKARVFLVFMFCFFEILINVQEGVSSIDTEYIDVGKSFGLSWLELQRNVLLPASLPHVFAGLNLGIGRAVRGMIVAELFLALVNLGDILVGSAATFNTSVQLAVVLTVTLTGVVAQGLVSIVEQQTIPWYYTAEVE